MESLVAAGLHEFLSGLIDYAGLFPPACLELPRALERFRAAGESQQGWMLARFVCPAGQLRAAVELWEERAPTRPLRLSVLAGSPLDGRFPEQLAEAGAVRSGGRARVEMIELKLASLPDTEDRIESLLRQLVRRLEQHGLGDIDVFAETPATLSPRLIPCLARIRWKGRLGFKLRCGGVEAAAFPNVEEVLQALRGCVAEKVPFKATAGLHHPVRYYDRGIGVTSHGFLNVFMAGLLCAIYPRNLEPARGCLEDQDPSRFHFREESVGWRGHEIPAKLLRGLRRSLMISFGSCSFREPLEDLQHLGWLQDPDNRLRVEEGQARS